ncbi:MAG TPA: hypothetical protein VFN42_07235, partial [Acetobacteraceae bacterium]|nr:hypothetical protein [Acetobacteraceae bacterium]
FIQDKGLAQARMVDNLIVGVSPAGLMTGSGADKVRMSGNVITDRPGVADEAGRLYFLTAHSPAVRRAVPAGDGAGFPLTARYEFVFPHGGQPRPVAGRPDVGAYAFVPGQRIPRPPVIRLHAEQPKVAYNAPARLTWTASDAEQCRASGGWSGDEPVSGTFTTQSLTQDTGFALTCSGPSGRSHASIMITVGESPQAAALGTYRWQRIAHSALERLCPSRTAYADIYGTTGCEAKQGSATGVYVQPAQEWYLLGGGGTNGYYGNEVYGFSLATLRPQRVTDPTHISAAREYMADDPSDKLHLKTCDGILHLKDGGFAPAPRGIVGQAAYDPRNRKIIVGPWGVVQGIGDCSGSTLGRFATDQWSFDPFTHQWSLLAPADERFGSTIPSTWFLDPDSGIAYDADGSRTGATRGAWLINYAGTPPHAELVNGHWPYAVSIGPVAVDTTTHHALQLIQQTNAMPPRIAVYDLRRLMGLYDPAGGREAADTSYRPDTSWTVTGDTGILAAAHPALTFNPKLGMFVAWAGGDAVYFLLPDYAAKTLSILVKHIGGGATPQGDYAPDGWFTYLPDHDAYLVFAGMQQDFTLLLPTGARMP